MKLIDNNTSKVVKSKTVETTEAPITEEDKKPVMALTYGEHRTVKPMSIVGREELTRIDQKTLERIWFNDPAIFNGINKVANEVVSSGYTFEGGSEEIKKEVIDWFIKINMPLKMHEWMIHLGAFGNAYGEYLYNRVIDDIVDIQVINPKEMKFIPSSKDDKLPQIDEDTGLIKGWQQTDMWVRSKKFTEESVPRGHWPKILHMVLYRIHEAQLGVGLIEPLYKTEERKINIEHASGEAGFRIGLPLIWAQLGDELHYPTDDQLNAFGGVLKDIHNKNQIVTPYTAKINILEPKEAAPLRDILDYYERQVTAGLGVPQFLLYGSGKDVNRACYDENTRVLTENGFKYHDEVDKNERIVLYNPKNGKAWLEEPNKLYEFVIKNEEVISFKNDAGINIKVTPEHKIWASVSTNNGLPCFKEFKAKDLMNRGHVALQSGLDWQGNNLDTVVIPEKMIKGGRNARINKEILLKAEDAFELLGYIISEGGISKEERITTLAQVNDEIFNDIINCLKRCNLNFHTYDSKDGCHRINIYNKQVVSWLRKELGSYCNEKRIPVWVKNSNKENLSKLFEALMKGDGSWDKRKRRTCGAYSTTSEQLADDVLEIAQKLGHNAHKTIHYEKFGNRKKLYRVLISKRNLKYVNVSKELYSGKAYCFNVSSGYYVTERNGCIGLQGNTANSLLEQFYRMIITFQEKLAYYINIIIKRLVEVRNSGRKRDNKSEIKPEDIPVFRFKDPRVEPLDSFAERMKKYMDVGLIISDSTLESYIREREGLPEREAKKPKVEKEHKHTLEYLEGEELPEGKQYFTKEIKPVEDAMVEDLIKGYDTLFDETKKALRKYGK